MTSPPGLVSETVAATKEEFCTLLFKSARLELLDPRTELREEVFCFEPLTKLVI
jgi:hypothetical protein